MTYICRKWLKNFQKRVKYLGNDVEMWELAKICWEMGQVFDKRLKYLGNDLQIWEMGKICGKWHRYMGHGLSI